MQHATSLEKEFFAAICHNESELVLRLLAMGCKVNAFFENGLTPLMVAARAGADDVLEVLLQGGADAQAVDADGRNALNWLCRSGQGCHSYLERHTEPARKLLAAGAGPYRCDSAGDSACWQSRLSAPGGDTAPAPASERARGWIPARRWLQTRGATPRCTTPPGWETPRPPHA